MCHVAALKVSPYNDIILILKFYGPFQHLFGSNPGIGGVRVASAITSHVQTQSNPVCCFQSLGFVFPKDLFSDYLYREC